VKISELKVEEYTSPSVITVASTETLDRAMELMQEHKIRHLPVIINGSIGGIISERDVLTHIGKDWTRMLKIEDIMTTTLLTVSKNESLGDVAFQLSSQKIGSALVLDDDESLYGIFTTTDALNALVEIFYPIPGATF
jgi:acetoin utilization protein AcuB